MHACDVCSRPFMDEISNLSAGERSMPIVPEISNRWALLVSTPMILMILVKLMIDGHYWYRPLPRIPSFCSVAYTVCVSALIASISFSVLISVAVFFSCATVSSLIQSLNLFKLVGLMKSAWA